MPVPYIGPRKRRELAAKRKKPPLFTHKRWQECYQAFLAQLRAKNPVSTTSKLYDQYLRRFFVDPDKSPDAYLRQDVERFLRMPGKDGRTLGPESYNARLTALSSFYDYARDYEYLFRGAAVLLMVRKPPTHGIAFAKTSDHARAMSDDELTRLFAAIDASSTRPILKLRDRALFITYLWSGRRRCEISQLRWGNLEQVTFYERGVLRTLWIYHWRGKGHTAIDDSAEMPEEAMSAIQAYLEADGRWGKMSATDPIFPGRYPQDTITPDWINKIFCAHAQKAGITQMGIHRFRHTRARATYELDYNIERVREVMRHRSIETTRKYIQSNKRLADEDAPRLRQRFGHL